MTHHEAWLTLSDREKRLILHVARYWLTTVAVVQRWLWPELSPDAVRKAITRLAEKEWLNRHLLAGQEPYFVLGAKAVGALDLRRSTAPLGHQALLQHYAVLLACARRQSDVITEDEFRSQFPDLSEPGYTAKHYFVDGSGNPARLGCFIVDHDKLCSRMVAKIGRRIGKLMSSVRPMLRQLVLNRQLAFHVITATDEKRASLEAAFARKPLGVCVLIESFPDDLGEFFLVNRR